MVLRHKYTKQDFEVHGMAGKKKGIQVRQDEVLAPRAGTSRTVDRPKGMTGYDVREEVLRNGAPSIDRMPPGWGFQPGKETSGTLVWDAAKGKHVPETHRMAIEALRKGAVESAEAAGGPERIGMSSHHSHMEAFHKKMAVLDPENSEFHKELANRHRAHMTAGHVKVWE